MAREVQWKRCCFWVISLFLTFIILSGGASVAWAAEKQYPGRPVTVIVGFPPGGGADLASKVIAEKMTEFLGQPLVYNYKPGGGSALAYNYVANSKPDGYTVGVVSSSSMYPPEVKKVDYKLEDFTLTGVFGSAPVFILVKSNSNWKTLKDFVEDAKKTPGKFSYGSAGPTSTGFYIYSLLRKYSGIQLTHVPFAGCSEVMVALLGGHIDAYFCGGAPGLNENSLIRGLAVAESTRLETLPALPTIVEFGYPVEYSGRYAFMFPKGTPEEVVDRFSDAQQKVVKKYHKEIVEALMKVDLKPVFLDRHEAVKEFKRQYELLRMIMKEAGPAKK